MKIIKILFTIAVCFLVANEGFSQSLPLPMPLPMPVPTAASQPSVPVPASPQPVPSLTSLPMPVPSQAPLPQPAIPAAAITQMTKPPASAQPVPVSVALPVAAVTSPAPVTLTLPGLPQTPVAATVTVASKSPMPAEPPKIEGEVQVAGKSPAPLSGDKKIDAHDEEENIYLNFENASLASLLHYLGEQKKINVLPHKDLENAKVTLTTKKPLTFQRAWDILLTLLEMNGFTMVKVGKLYRIVSSNDNGQEPLPIYSSNNGIDPEKLPDSDIVIRYVYFFKNMKTPTAKSILATMLEDKNIIENADLNACVIKGKSLTIKTAMKIITELDSGGLREAIEIVQLKWTSVDMVKKMFTDIFGGEEDNRTIRFSPIKKAKESAFFSSDTKIIPEPVKNSLILMGTQKNIDKIKSFLAKYIDVPIEDAASRIHMKELKYLRATDASQLLMNIIRTPRGSAGEKAVVVEGGFKIFEDVVISAEGGDDAGSTEGSRYGSGNRLVIACNRDDWSRIEEFIDKLDKPQPQVAIEVMVVDVGLKLERELGAQLYNARGNPIAHNVNAAFDNLAAGAKAETGGVRLEDPLINLAKPTALGQNSPTFLTLGKAASTGDPLNENIWALIKAVTNVTNNQVISQPYLVANNNQKCQVTVKTTWRVQGDLDTTKLQTTQRRDNIDATVTVALTPHISLTGTVDLEIDVTVNAFQQTSLVQQPTVTNRQLTTKASMSTGEVLVLGGLTKSDLKENVWKTPILGDIPILGNLFKDKTKTKVESNLYIFIRPSIIKPNFEGQPDEYTQLKLDYAKLQVMRGDTYVPDGDPIQRWFFSPTHQSIKERVTDAGKGILRPVDKYIFGYDRPKSVKVKDDPYFKVSEALEKSRLEREARKQETATRYKDPILAPASTQEASIKSDVIQG